MVLPPLRAIVLDNDETTGSYPLVFAILASLTYHKIHDVSRIQKVLQRLALWMNVHHCFRPGLRQLLQTLLTLRAYGKINAIIMYTNQSEILPTKPTDPPALLTSPPQAIAYMLNCLLGQQVFDHILTRPTGSIPTPSGHFTKTFERVLDLYPQYPRDIRDIIFVDDLAYKPLLTADTISLTRREDLSWYLVEPYHKVLTTREIVTCIEYCCKDIPNYYSFVDPISTYLAMYTRSQKSTTANAKIFQVLQYYVQKKFLKNQRDG